MAILLDGVPRTLTRGRYAIKVDTNGGTAILNWKLTDGDGTDQNLFGAPLSAPDNFEVSLPNCIVEAALTGAATVRISSIETYGTKTTN